MWARFMGSSLPVVAQALAQSARPSALPADSIGENKFSWFPLQRGHRFFVCLVFMDTKTILLPSTRVQRERLGVLGPQELSSHHFVAAWGVLSKPW